jgi:uncharacterized Fe-S cluster-containing protein
MPFAIQHGYAEILTSAGGFVKVAILGPRTIGQDIEEVRGK